MSFVIPSLQGFVKPPTLWTPLNLTNLKAWFDGKDSSTITLNGSTVSQFAPKSGSYVASQSTASLQPTYDSTNGRLSFDGGDYLSMTATSADIAKNVGEFNIFTLASISSTTPSCIFQAARGTGVESRASLYKSNVGVGFEAGGRRLDTNSYQQISVGSANSNVTIVQCRFDYANSNLYLYINGGLNQSKTDFQTDGNTSDTDSNWIGIGAANGASNFMSGYLYQLILAGAMTAAERQKLEGWCAHYTGQTALLAADHPYKNSPPTMSIGDKLRLLFNGRLFKTLKASKEFEQSIKENERRKIDNIVQFVQRSKVCETVPLYTYRKAA